MRRIKSPQEKGYLIPVKRPAGRPGVYKKGWAKSLTPINGKIKICFDSGKTSQWDFENTEIIENYNIVWSSENLIND